MFVYSALTQLTWSLILHTQLTESLTLRRLSVNEMNQAKTGIQNQLWRL
jgi:hypothetical protein